MTGGAIYPRADLYASVRVGGVWQPARNLGPAVNTPASGIEPGRLARREAALLHERAGVYGDPDGCRGADAPSFEEALTGS